MFPYRPGVRTPVPQLFGDSDQRYLQQPTVPGSPPAMAGVPSSAVRSGNTPAWGGIGDDEVAAQIARDPSIAYAHLRAAQGKQGIDRSIYGAGRANRYGQAVQALAQLGGKLDPATITELLNSVSGAIGGGSGLGGMLREAGAGAMDRDLSALTDPQRLAVMNALAGAATYDMPSLWRGTVTNPLEEMEMGAIQQGAGNDTTGVLTQDNIEASPFWAAIQQLMGGTR